jgi:arsenite methyltransferase
MTATVEVFDPSMCCSTGVCGPSVDPLLPRFAADLDWLKNNGIQVSRHNLAQEPAAFAAAPAVQAALAARGTDCLPLILVDGRIVSQGAYPTRAELGHWAGLDGDPATSAEVPKSSCCGPSAATDASTASAPAPVKSSCC